MRSLNEWPGFVLFASRPRRLICGFNVFNQQRQPECSRCWSSCNAKINAIQVGMVSPWLHLHQLLSWRRLQLRPSSRQLCWHYQLCQAVHQSLNPCRLSCWGRTRALISRGALPLYVLCAHAMPLTFKRLAGLNCCGCRSACPACLHLIHSWQFPATPASMCARFATALNNAHTASSHSHNSCCPCAKAEHTHSALESK